MFWTLFVITKYCSVINGSVRKTGFKCGEGSIGNEQNPLHSNYSLCLGHTDNFIMVTNHLFFIECLCLACWKTSSLDHRPYIHPISLTGKNGFQCGAFKMTFYWCISSVTKSIYPTQRTRGEIWIPQKLLHWGTTWNSLRNRLCSSSCNVANTEIILPQENQHEHIKLAAFVNSLWLPSIEPKNHMGQEPDLLSKGLGSSWKTSLSQEGAWQFRVPKPRLARGRATNQSNKKVIMCDQNSSFCHRGITIIHCIHLLPKCLLHIEAIKYISI